MAAAENPAIPYTSLTPGSPETLFPLTSGSKPERIGDESLIDWFSRFVLTTYGGLLS